MIPTRIRNKSSKDALSDLLIAHICSQDAAAAGVVDERMSDLLIGYTPISSIMVVGGTKQSSNTIRMEYSNSTHVTIHSFEQDIYAVYWHCINLKYTEKHCK